MANPNIISMASMYGGTDVLNATTAASAITTAGSDTIKRVNTLLASNKSSNAITVSADIYRNSVSYPLVQNVTISAGAMFAIIGKDTPVYLNEGDSIRVSASANTSAVAFCSYETLS